MNSFHKYYRRAVPVFFAFLLLLNYLSAAGIILPATQAEVSDKYVNLFAPAGITFSIWAVIYIGMALTISIDFIRPKGDRFGALYRQLILPRMIEWIALNIVWIICWSNEWLLASLIVILLYTTRIMKSVETISATPTLRENPWLLKYSMGLHFGWLLVASMANLTTYTVSQGVDLTGTIGIIWTVALMIVVVALSAYYYTKLGNEMIMPVALWAILGIFIKHSPFSSFEYKSNIVMYVAAVLFVISAVGFVQLFRLQKEQRAKRANK